MSRKTCLWVAALLMLPNVAWALEVGEPAPPLSVERWVAGSPLQDVSRPGATLTVVAFWATWSTPALDSLAGLARIQQALGDSKVAVVAITAESASEVREFLNTNPQRKPQGVRLAVDDHQQTTKAYLRAVGQHALPHAFVIDTAGKLAWHGHPDDARAVLDALIAGTFQMSKAPAAPPTQGTVEIDRQALAALNDAVVAQDWRSAVNLIDRIISRQPDALGIDELMGNKFMILYERLRDDTAAESFARDVLKQHRDQPRVLNNIAWSLLARGDFERLDRRWPDIAHQAARLAFEATSGEDPAILDTYARSMYLLGRVEPAKTHQEKAVDLLRGMVAGLDSEADADRVAELKEALEAMRQTLEYYEEILKVREQVSP